MAIISKLILLRLTGTFLAGCSGRPSVSRKMEITFGGVTGVNGTNAAGNGGAVVRIQNATNGTYTDVELMAPPYTISLADGKWDFYFLSFSGPITWEGTTLCGGTSIDLGPSITDINITVNATNCIKDPYPAIIATKVSNWDQAYWDKGKWGI